jgi:acetyl esterase/lipase
MQKLYIAIILITTAAFACGGDFQRYEIVSSYRQTAAVYKKTDIGDLKAHIFVSTAVKKNDRRPVILYFHGGGWTRGAAEGFFRSCRHFSVRGWTAISFEYRLADWNETNPIHCIMDTKSAIRWVRKNSEKLHIDPDRIVIAGQSAGGHLALSSFFITAFNEKSDDLSISCKPNAIICYSTCYDTKRVPHFISLLPKSYSLEKTSPYYNICPGAPPVLMFHTRQDKIVAYRQADDFYRKMQEYKNHCELITFNEGSHDLFADYAEEILAWQEDFLIRMGFEIP